MIFMRLFTIVLVFFFPFCSGKRIHTSAVMSKRQNSEMEASTPPRSKKRKYSCKFNASWTLQFRHIRKSEKGDKYAYCAVCNSNFGIFNGGKHDVERHCKTNAHINNDRTTMSTPKVATVFAPRDDPLTKKVTAAEVLFAGFVVEHNLPFAVADHFSDLVKVMFPDSEIAKKFRCKSQKTANLVNEALAPAVDKHVSELCKKEKFSVLMDESNDRGNDKGVAILVRVLDRSVRKVVTGFLSMPICNIGTGANLFGCLEQVFVDRDIPWENLIGYTSDNASVMVGRHNSVLSRIKEKQPKVYDLGCVCHVANTCLSYGLKKLPSAVEELLIDIYYHFLHSSKRKEEYKEFVVFTDTEPAKLIKHCPTRWLSLEKCVNRTLQQWAALKSYFNSHDDVEKKGSRVSKCAASLNDPLLELVYYFLQYILSPLLEFNTTFQADEAMVGYVHQEMKRLLRKFLGKFVVTASITSVPCLTSVDFKNPSNQHPDSNLAVGMPARQYLLDNPDLPRETISSFFSTVREFYVEVTEKMIQKFPFKDQTLQTLGFLNPDLRQDISPESVVQLSQDFKMAIPVNSLEDEYADFQLSPKEDLPPFTYGETNLDDFWFEISELTLPAGNKRFLYLPELAFAAISLPHSNADTERCFSLVRKTRTETRERLNAETVSAVLSVKVNTKVDCCDVKLSEELLKSARQACAKYNDKHK